MILSLLSVAMAAPDHVAATIGSGDIHDVTVSSSGNIVAWIDAFGTVTVYDGAGWIGGDVVSDCTATAGVAVATTSEGYTILAGCDDGRVLQWGADVYGRVTGEQTELVTHAGAVLALETDDTNVYVVATNSAGDGTEVDAYDLADGTEVSDFPVSLAYDTVQDTILIEDYLYVVHDSSKVSKVYLTSPAASVPSDTISASFVDGWAYSSGTVYLADSGGSVILYQPSANNLSISLDDIATEVNGVVGGTDYMLVATDIDVLQYAFSNGSPAGQEAVIDGAAGIGEMVVVGDYALGATSAGVSVLTAVPWITDVSLSESLAAVGYEVSVDFVSDMDGTFRLSRGTSAELATGSVVAGETTTATFTVDDGFVEGTNRLYITVTSGGLEGIGAADLEVNNPPAGIDLREGEVLPGDEQIHILTGKLTEEDLAYVDVYLSTEQFDPGVYAQTGGGPDYAGPDDKTNPVSKAVTVGITDEVIVKGLTNGTTYYVAVRPRDSSGLEGSMSDVFSVTPDETYTIAEMKGDDSGFCGVTGARAGWIGVVAGLLIARRRTIAGAAMVAALITPGLAQARETERPTWDVEVRYGPYITQAEPYLTDSFGTGNTLLRIEYGWRSQFLEADLGVGLYRDNGYLYMADGTLSGDATIFTNVPLDLSLTGRLHFWDNQPIIPYGRIGGTYSLWVQDWHENPLDTEYESRSGGKFGWHWGAGVMLLLDWLDEKAASELQVSAGIDDTYLVAEYRAAYMMHADNEIDLSESDLTIGLKFDF